MSSVARAASWENDAPLVRGRQPTKFTPDNLAKIKEWVAQGVGRDEIANRLAVTVGSLQVTCSKLGISLRRKSSFAEGNAAIPPLRVVQGSIEHTPHSSSFAVATFSLLIKTQTRQAAF